MDLTPITLQWRLKSRSLSNEMGRVILYDDVDKSSTLFQYSSHNRTILTVASLAHQSGFAITFLQRIG